MKIAEINLVGYREWTESLGYDREWKIQKFQHSFTARLTELASEINSFLLTYRYDSYIFLLDGVSLENFYSVLDKVRDLSSVPISICLGFGKTLLEAERNCYYNDFKDIHDEKIVLAHFDLDGFSKKRSLFDAYLEIYDIYNKIFEFSRDVGGFAYYFGGDNIGVFMGLDKVEEVKRVVNEVDNIKVGIGVGNTPREAVTKAAKALHIIRLYRDRKIEISQD